MHWTDWNYMHILYAYVHFKMGGLYNIFQILEGIGIKKG